jgi:hypothetical protein
MAGIIRVGTGRVKKEPVIAPVIASLREAISGYWEIAYRCAAHVVGLVVE